MWNFQMRDEFYCRDCGAIINPENLITTAGMVDKCPECGGTRIITYQQHLYDEYQDMQYAYREDK